MTVEKVMITNGIVVGAIINDNGTEKKARLSDVQKLLEKGKITSGARLVSGIVALDKAVLQNRYEQPVYNLDSVVKDENGDITAVILEGGKQVDIKTAWSLAADNRINGLQAAYMKDIDSKVIMSA